MRRERAKAVASKDEEGKAAQAANRAAAKSRNVEVIAEIIDQRQWYALFVVSRPNPFVWQKKRKKQQALRRLQSKGQTRQQTDR